MPFSAMAHKHLAGPVVQPEVASEMVESKEGDKRAATYLVSTRFLRHGRNHSAGMVALCYRHDTRLRRDIAAEL